MFGLDGSHALCRFLYLKLVTGPLPFTFFIWMRFFCHKELRDKQRIVIICLNKISIKIPTVNVRSWNWIKSLQNHFILGLFFFGFKRFQQKNNLVKLHTLIIFLCFISISLWYVLTMEFDRLKLVLPFIPNALSFNWRVVCCFLCLWIMRCSSLWR